MPSSSCPSASSTTGWVEQERELADGCWSGRARTRVRLEGRHDGTDVGAAGLALHDLDLLAGRRPRFLVVQLPHGILRPAH